MHSFNMKRLTCHVTNILEHLMYLCVFVICVCVCVSMCVCVV